MSHQIHSYSELQQQIHEDLRIQHPEWVGSVAGRPGATPMSGVWQS